MFERLAFGLRCDSARKIDPLCLRDPAVFVEIEELNEAAIEVHDREAGQIVRTQSSGIDERRPSDGPHEALMRVAVNDERHIALATSRAASGIARISSSEEVIEEALHVVGAQRVAQQQRSCAGQQRRLRR